MNKTEMARTSAFVGKQVGKLDGMLGDSFSRIVPASNRKNLSNSSFVQGGERGSGGEGKCLAPQQPPKSAPIHAGRVQCFRWCRQGSSYRWKFGGEEEQLKVSRRVPSSFSLCPCPSLCFLLACKDTAIRLMHTTTSNDQLPHLPVGG